MAKSKSTLATVWLMVLRLMELHGLDSQQLIAELGVSAQTLCDVQARIPARVADLAFERAMQRLPDPAFALRASECWHPSNLGTMGYAWLSSRTLHTGLKRLERFSRIIGDDFSYEVREDQDGLHVTHDHGRGDNPVGHVMTDFTLSIIFDMCRSNFGSRLSARQVQLRRPWPANTAPWEAFFGCAVQFGANKDSFLIDSAAANAPLTSANSLLANTFDVLLSEQLDRYFQDDIVSRCKTFLLRELTSGPPSAISTAAGLAMSQRSFQRRLRELGLTYRELLDQTRHELARRYLDDPAKSVTEITFLLGFSEQSAFTRAFKRWSGTSPSGYRGTPVTDSLAQRRLHGPTG
ncbi:MAG: AraC family transcriptional regulator [Rhodoferax sp.]|uniref:AraC family transcriptional regulator n=1 Tax=Rhodoferax sp. TaxID=50421 RepID=UPI001B416EE1|nr:AraC family transcriptional regulator [Rhodoferax sp.]MBP9904374.1 AraC family transcriptional regulator [Rhodoferax sp.]